MSTGIMGGNVTSINIIQVTADVSSIAANQTQFRQITVQGVKVGDQILTAKPTEDTGLSLTDAYVSADNEVSMGFVNATSGSINPGSQVYHLTVLRPEGDGTNLPTGLSI